MLVRAMSQRNQGMFGLSEKQDRRFAYGLWRYGADEVDAAIEALSFLRENDVCHFDTADCYGGASGFGGSERLLGAVRKRAPELLSGAAIATKAGVEPGSPYNSSGAYLKAACDASLKRLGVERVDLFYIHRPDLLTHPAELAGALDGLVEAGKIGAVGVSNFTTHQVAALAGFLKAPICVHQIEFSVAHIEPLFDGTLDQAMERGIAVAAWSPFAGGRLGEAGPPELERVRGELKRIAEEHAAPAVAVALAFIGRHPAPVTPILGSKRPERLRDCLKARSLSLSRRDWYAIVEACRGEAMP